MSLPLPEFVQCSVIDYDAELNVTIDGHFGIRSIPYGEFVATLVKKLPSPEDDIMHAAIGIAGEGGEILDAAKKHWVYNKPLDRENIIEECGDVIFYLTALMMLVDTNMTEVINKNVKKLQARYPGMSYSDAAAQARMDKRD